MRRRIGADIRTTPTLCFTFAARALSSRANRTDGGGPRCPFAHAARKLCILTRRPTDGRAGRGRVAPPLDPTPSRLRSGGPADHRPWRLGAQLPEIGISDCGRSAHTWLAARGVCITSLIAYLVRSWERRCSGRHSRPGADSAAVGPRLIDSTIHSRRHSYGYANSTASAARGPSGLRYVSYLHRRDVARRAGSAPFLARCCRAVAPV